MPVSNRLRFEVLRRDNFACRYCGAKAPNVELHVDHVIPKKFGGTDDAWNLTAACPPCNWGKGDGVPSGSVIQDVRLAESLYLSSRGGIVIPCEYCSLPIQFEAGDNYQFNQCETCSDAISEAYAIGRKAGALHGA